MNDFVSPSACGSFKFAIAWTRQRWNWQMLPVFYGFWDHFSVTPLQWCLVCNFRPYTVIFLIYLISVKLDFKLDRVWNVWYDVPWFSFWTTGLYFPMAACRCHGGTIVTYCKQDVNKKYKYDIMHAAEEMTLHDYCQGLNISTIIANRDVFSKSDWLAA